MKRRTFLGTLVAGLLTRRTAEPVTMRRSKPMIDDNGGQEDGSNEPTCDQYLEAMHGGYLTRNEIRQIQIAYGRANAHFRSEAAGLGLRIDR